MDLMTLSTNLYLISKDEKFFAHLTEMAEKGREKVREFMDSDGDGELLANIREKAAEAKAELEKKLEETVKAVYEKMQITHLEKLKELEDKVDRLQNELLLAEARIVNLEMGRK